MAPRYHTFAFALLLLLVPALAGHAADYDTPGLGSVVQGQAKVVAVIGAGESGAPAGFTIQWMELSEFQANGSQWPDASDPRRADANFDGVPTLNTWDGTLTSFEIPAWGFAAVEIGDLFDETGVATDSPQELDMGTSYVLRVRANGDGTNGPSAFSNDLIVSTDINTNCTLTQGFWKNHPTVWPTSMLTLGDNTYSAAQLLAILGQPAQGNGLVILAHQLIAAELNVAQGADLSEVEDALTAAHSLIGSLIVPPLGAGNIHPRDASSIAQVLDDYNNGVTGPGHCDTVSIDEVSWSDVKASYR